MNTEGDIRMMDEFRRSTDRVTELSDEEAKMLIPMEREERKRKLREMRKVERLTFRKI